MVFANLLSPLGVMGSATTTKKWGKGRQFWGLNWDYDPQWILTEEQREIQGQLMECCRNVIRPNAVSLNGRLLASLLNTNVRFLRIGRKTSSTFCLASKKKMFCCVGKFDRSIFMKHKVVVAHHFYVCVSGKNMLLF